MTNHVVSNRADLRERTKTMSRHGDRRGQIADFRDRFETINWLYLLFKCGIKTKTHFEWLLWHWSSLGQLNLEPTRPKGLVGCKVPTDLVKISVKEATHMGFHYIIRGASRHFYGALTKIIIWGPTINIWGLLLFTGVPQLQKYIVSVTLEPPYVTEKPDTLQWRHSGCDGVSNIQPQDCLLNRLFTGHITGPLSCLCGEFANHQFVRGIHGGSRSVNSPHTHDKGPVIRVLFSFDDIIMDFKN